MNWSKSVSLSLTIALSSLTLFVLSGVCTQEFANDPIVNRVRSIQTNNANSKPTPVPFGRFSSDRDDQQEVDLVIAAANEAGLGGKWIVLSVEKDGEFSKAQIGQQPNDVISIMPSRDNYGGLVFG